MYSFYLYAQSPDNSRIELVRIPCESVGKYDEISKSCEHTSRINREDGEWKVLRTFTYEENMTLTSLHQLNPSILEETLKRIELPFKKG